MRIGLVGPLPPPAGGMANQTRQLAGLLQAEGIEVCLARTNEPYWPPVVGRLRGVRGLFRLVPYLARLLRMAREADVAHVMANSGWAWHLCAAPAIMICATRGVPVVVNYRGGLAREFLAKSGSRVLPTLKHASAVVVPSRFLQEVFSQFGIRAEIIPNVVNLEIFRPDPASREAGLHIAVARNLERIYGIDVAIQAIARLRQDFPELTVSIAGTGPERASLERLTAQLGLTDCIRFTGSLDAAGIASLYRRAHVMLNPSRADNTPNAIIEAAACGVPIVSTNVGGIPYLVEHERSAWLVPPDAPEAMAEGLRRVLTDPTLQETLRTNAIALAQSCSWSSVRRKWLDLYHRVGARTPAQRRAAVGMEK